MILQSAAISASATSNTLVSAVSGRRIAVYRFFISNAVATAQAFTVQDGSTGLTGAIALPTAVGGFISMFASAAEEAPIFITSSGNALNMALANATATAGYLQYGII